MNLAERAALVSALFGSTARAQFPQPYCTAGTSTNGCTPSIDASAQPNTTNTAGCVITTSGVEGQRLGVVFHGVDNTGFTPLSWGVGSSSFLCVQPPVARVGPIQSSGGAAGQCDGSYVIDWDAMQDSNPTALGNPWILGDKVFVQAWYRDPQAARGTSLSNAVELSVRSPQHVSCVTTIPGMVVISSGTFAMGSDAPHASPYWNGTIPQPVHSVTLSYCFWMGATEVTQAQYSSLMGANPSAFPGANRPVERVTWLEAQAYCAALTAQQSALGSVPTGYQYRLPTEAEWEYACRAGTTTESNVGAGLLCDQAKFYATYHTNNPVPFCIGAVSTVPVASYLPNAWGLYDRHGNVSEWCLDSLAVYSASAASDPFVTGGADRVARGGSWWNTSDGCRSAMRFSLRPDLSHVRLGFRVVLAPILAP